MNILLCSVIVCSYEHTITELAEFHCDLVYKQPSVATKNSTVIALTQQPAFAIQSYIRCSVS